MPLLQLSDVCLAYGHAALLDHASLVIEAGEHVGLIGRNGTGKSSLLRILEGSARADDGKVWLAPGLKLAFVAQEPAFRPGHTVFEAVAEGLRAYVDELRIAMFCSGCGDLRALRQLQLQRVA